MPVLSVDDAGDPRLADYIGVPDPQLARARGVFVAEGRLVVRRLLASRFVTRSVMVTPAALDSVAGELERQPCLPVFVVPQLIINAVAGFNIHRGCLALGERPAPCTWQDVAELRSRADRGCGSAQPAESAGRAQYLANRLDAGSLLDPPSARVLIALEHVGNADNVGATFRAAAAFGAGGILLDHGCADPLYRKAIRTSMGAALHVPFAQDVPWTDALAGLRSDGWAVVGLSPAAGAAPVREVFAHTRGARVVLVLGHEGDGISAATAAACTHLARIPMTAAVDSLNLAMAAGIALYEWASEAPR